MYLHQRFESYLSEPDKNGCRIWRGIVKAGRGMFLLSTRPHRWMSAHKWAYRFYKGPVPLGCVIRSWCGQPLCMAHIKPVRSNTLVLEAIQKGLFNPYHNLKGHVPNHKGEKNGNSHYSNDFVDQIKKERENGSKIQVIAMRHKMPVSSVWWICTGRACVKN